MIGKEIRLSKILDPQDNRAVVVAADHGLMLGPIQGVKVLHETLVKVIEGKPDAILLAPGQALRLYELFKGKNAPALLIRADWTNAFRDRTYTLPARSIRFTKVIEPKKALALGASAIVTYYFVGIDDELESQLFKQLSDFAKECDKWGLPLVVEPIPVGPKVTKTNFTDLVVLGVRLAVEVGADMIKAPYTGDPDSFQRVISAAAGTPVLILGGYRARSVKDLLEVVEEMINVGGSGVVFGRNVIQSPNPAQILRQIRAIVHEGKSVKEVLFEVGKPIRIVTKPELCIGCKICVLICSIKHYRVIDEKLSAIKVEGSWPGPFKPITCTHCGLCVKVCPTHALTFDERTGGLVWNRELCTFCGECVKICPQGVLQIVGKNLIHCDLCGGIPECVYWCPRDVLEIKPIG